jgi:hypothetical protein
MRARDKPEVERKHCTRSEDMTEPQDPEFSVSLFRLPRGVSMTT